MAVFGCASREAPFLGDEENDLVDVLGFEDDIFERFRVSLNGSIESTAQSEESSPDVPQLKEAPPRRVAPPSKQVEKPEEPKEKQPKITQRELPKTEQEDEEGGIEFSGEEYPEEFHAYDERSRKIWDIYEPLYFPHEEKHFAIRYLGITAGHIKVTTRPMARINDRPVMHYQGHMRSARFYEYIYRLDDSIETYVDAHTQVPLRYTLIQRESGQDVDDFQVFDHEERKTYFRYKRVRRGETREDERVAFVPELFQDSFSALFFARGLPYNIGDVYEFPIITRARLWILKMEVEAIEDIRVMRQRIPAYRVRAETRFPGVLERRGDILFWFSADDKKRLLRFRADVRIGSIAGELTDYKPGLPTPEF